MHINRSSVDAASMWPWGERCRRSLAYTSSTSSQYCAIISRTNSRRRSLLHARPDTNDVHPSLALFIFPIRLFRGRRSPREALHIAVSSHSRAAVCSAEARQRAQRSRFQSDLISSRQARRRHWNGIHFIGGEDTATDNVQRNGRDWL